MMTLSIHSRANNMHFSLHSNALRAVNLIKASATSFARVYYVCSDYMIYIF